MASSPQYPDSSDDQLNANPNGAGDASGHHHRRLYRPSPQPSVNVRVIHHECGRNHAASIGGHAVDGCHAFLACNTADPAEPTSLICAACGCHRNFHRPQFLYPSSPSSSSSPSSWSDLPSPHPRSPTPPVAARPLLAVRAGGSVEPDPVPEPPRKRVRTKFTPGQKEMMHQFAQELGWKLRKTNEPAVEAKCGEIGVRPSVFKVWMHNNKYAATNAARAAAAAAAAAAAPADQIDPAVQVDTAAVVVSGAAAEGDELADAAAVAVAPADEGYGDAAAADEGCGNAAAAAADDDEGYGNEDAAAAEGDEDAATDELDEDAAADEGDEDAAADEGDEDAAADELDADSAADEGDEDADA